MNIFDATSPTTALHRLRRPRGQGHRGRVSVEARLPAENRRECAPNRFAIVGHPRIGGLHHRYEWRQAA